MDRWSGHGLGRRMEVPHREQRASRMFRRWIQPLGPQTHITVPVGAKVEQVPIGRPCRIWARFGRPNDLHPLGRRWWLAYGKRSGTDCKVTSIAMGGEHDPLLIRRDRILRSEEHTSELQS